jgi:hypothetical protein
MRLKPFIPMIMILVVIVMVAKMSMAYVEPFQRQAGENAIFSHLARQVYLTSSTTADITPASIVGTAIQPPYRLRIYNTAAGYTIHRGLLARPTATCTPLLAGSSFNEVYTALPNWYLATTATVTNIIAEVWTAE